MVTAVFLGFGNEVAKGSLQQVQSEAVVTAQALCQAGGR